MKKYELFNKFSDNRLDMELWLQNLLNKLQPSDYKIITSEKYYISVMLEIEEIE